MKDYNKLLFVIIVFFSHVAAVCAQVQNLSQESEDSTINVISFFCKNDTMDYRISMMKYKIHENDTTLNYFTSSDFRIIVRDSTSNGYKLEYIELGNRQIDGDEVDFLDKGVWSEIASLSEKQHVIFTIDELGNLQHIENWREVKQTMYDSIDLLCDSLYAKTPELDSVMPRSRLEMSMKSRYASEESMWGVYEELQLLFGVHGKSFTIGRNEIKDDSGYPSITTSVASYGSYEEDEALDGDYFILGKTTQTIPSEDVATIVSGQLSGMLSDDAVRKMKEANLNNLLEDAQLTNLEAYYLFYNGWPCDMSKQLIMTLNGFEYITTKHIVWLSRSWHVYGGQKQEQQET